MWGYKYYLVFVSLIAIYIRPLFYKMHVINGDLIYEMKDTEMTVNICNWNDNSNLII